MGNLTLAWRNARKGKTTIPEVMAFDEDIERNLLNLHNELLTKTYKPLPLTTFVLRDPKTRVISKSNFRDRVIHHALINVICPIFEPKFVYDSCANQKNKGTLLAIQRFHKFQRKVTHNYSRPAFCLKADIKHYFQTVDHEILLEIIKRRIKDKEVIWLIEQILANVSLGSGGGRTQKGMPLGNLTSQFFANIYLNELDYFVKHQLKIRYYIRYVDDFVIFHHSRKKLELLLNEIDNFLTKKLLINLHPDKSRIIPLIRGVDFIGFRNFYHHSLLRKRNVRIMQRKIELYKEGKWGFDNIFESYQGWRAYAKWADAHKLSEKIKLKIIDYLWDEI